MEIRLRPWNADDLELLRRINAPEMTRHLGGPETDDEVVARHEKYLRLQGSGTAHMFAIEVDGDPAGSIGFWHTDEESRPAWEIGWSVLPHHQGRGVAGEALRQAIARVAADGSRDLLVAYPGVDNAASNALCRRAGFTHVDTITEPWRGGELTSNVWALELGQAAAITSSTASP